MDVERCNECGFNGEEWSDAASISAIAGLPTRFAKPGESYSFAVGALPPVELTVV